MSTVQYGSVQYGSVQYGTDLFLFVLFSILGSTNFLFLWSYVIQGSKRAELMLRGNTALTGQKEESPVDVQ